MDIIYNIIVLIGAILQIILFFKIWGATNDIRKMREKMCGTAHVPVREEKAAEPVRRESPATKKNDAPFSVGEWVTSRDNTERIMYIVSIDEDGDYQCSTPEGEYTGTFRKDDLMKS